MKVLSFGLLMATVASFGLTAPAARAQAAGPSLAPKKNVSVRERPRPEYDATGIPMGAFQLFPELTLSGAYDDNVFAVDQNPVEDAIGTADERFRLASNWSSHALAFTLGAQQKAYAEYDDLNTSTYNAGVSGRLDIDRSANIGGGVSFLQGAESLAQAPSSLPLDEAVEYTMTGANLTASKTFNRMQVSGRALWSSYDYEDAAVVGGGFAEQDDRDRAVIEVGARLDYGLSPDTGFFLDVRANQRDYDLEPPVTVINRDSSGYEVLVGSRFDITNLIRGEIGVGYLSQSYDADGVDANSGVAVRGNVEWFPDELVTVTLSAARNVGDAGATGAVGYIGNDVAVKADYEFRRNIILTAQAGYSFDEYQEVDRSDKRWQAVLSAEYALNRNVAVYGSAGHYTQTSDGVDFGRDYDINQVMVGLRLRR